MNSLHEFTSANSSEYGLLISNDLWQDTNALQMAGNCDRMSILQKDFYIEESQA